MANEDDKTEPNPSKGVVQKVIKKTVEGVQTTASISTGAAKIANQSINPIAGLGATGATAAQITADAESATNMSLSEKERKASARNLARGTGLLITDVCVGIGYNCAADVETLGVAAAGTGNAIGIERAVNSMSAQLANFLEIPKIQKKLGLGDGTKYEHITDMPMDATMAVGGYDIVGKLADYRRRLENGIEKKTGLNFSDLHHITQLGARLTEAGLNIIATEPPDFTAITQHALALAQQAGLDTEKGKDFTAVANITNAVVNIAKHIDEGEFGFRDLKDIANASVQVASRAQAHGIIPQFAKDAQVVAELGSTVCTLAEHIEKGECSHRDVDNVMASSKNAVSRLEDREIIGPKTAHDLLTAAKTVELASSFSQGKLDANQMVNVTQDVLDSAQSHGLVGEKTASRIAKVSHVARNVTETASEISKSISEVKGSVSEIKSAVAEVKSSKKALIDKKAKTSDDLDLVLAKSPTPITHQAEEAKHATHHEAHAEKTSQDVSVDKSKTKLR